MPNMEVLVVHAAPQTALPRSVLAPTDTVGYPVDTVKRLFSRDQVRARLDIRPVLLRVVDGAQPAEVFDLPFAPEVLRLPVAPGNLMTLSEVATDRRLD